MNPLKFLPYILKQVTRHRVRTALTLLGVAAAMFLFTAVHAMHRGVQRTTAASAADTTLVVYRKDRFCPATSALPQDYLSRIERLEGVTSVLPVKIVVTNCRTSLDVVTFRGVPPERFLAERGDQIDFISGTSAQWLRRSDAAILGQTLAARRGLSVGQRFDAAGITVTVAAIIRSDDPQDQNVAYVALDFLQRAARNQQGIVTQFNVKVSNPALLEPVAAQIDDLFAHAQEPTSTYSEKAFMARVAQDVVELVSFARWLGAGCLVAVLALIANAIILSVQSRIAEHAVLQTLGFTGRLVAALVVAEGTILALLGGGLGALAAILVARFGSFALSVEGQSIPITADAPLLLNGLAACAALGILAGLVPAWQASRRPIASCFRSV